MEKTVSEMTALFRALSLASGPRLWSIPLILLALVTIGVPTKPVYAAGQLMVAPTRAVFEGRTRSAQMKVVNSGDEATTYRISFVQKRMTEDGQFVTIEEPGPGERFSNAMIRFSPRQVRLEPGQSQTVRLMLRKPANLEAGEYRSHMLFQGIPAVTGQSIEKLAGKEEKQLKIQLIPILGITIPVIVRHGTTSATVQFEKLALNTSTNDEPVLEFDLRRSGNQSIYGDLKATLVNAAGEESVIGRANGVAVYTPGNLRRVKLALQLSDKPLPAGATINLTYRQRPENGSVLLAEATLVVP